MNAIASSPPARNPPLPQSSARWLMRYYAGRALVSVIWIVLALTVGKIEPVAGAILLIANPLWDCVANFIDARHNGGLRANPTQFLNAAISAIVTIAVAIALTRSVDAATGVIGVWAGLSGLLQLATGVRRWRSSSAQWPQILSGAQSCFAATQILRSALHPSDANTVTSIWPYVAFGAFYFAVSAGVLAFKQH